MRPSGPHNLLGGHAASRLLGAVLILAFAIAGFRIYRHTTPASFAVPQMPAVSRAPMAATGLPAATRAATDPFALQAGFASSAAGKAVHAASLVELNDGRLRAVWFSGSREGAGDVTIQTAVMDARTLEWSRETTLIDRTQLQRGLWRYVKKLGNPVIARAPDGSLSLWMVNVSLGGWAGSSISALRSTDEGATWSAPRRLVTSPFLNISTLVKGGPVAYANGDIGLPVYHEFLRKFGEVLRLDAQGRPVDKVRIPGSQTSLQPVVLVQDARHARAYLRSGTAEALMTSSTSDGGALWSPTRATAWPNPDSAPAGVQTRAGSQWLAVNPENRNRDVLALLGAARGASIDTARRFTLESSSTPQQLLPAATYERTLLAELKARGVPEEAARADAASARRQLCNGETCSLEFSYPFMLQTRDGALHVIYTWHRTRIKHVRFDPAQPGVALP